MRALLLAFRGGTEAMNVGSAPMPRAGVGEIVVRVLAAGVTPTELQWGPTWSGMDGTPRPLPVIPGHEFSGVVEVLGDGVAGVSVGDAVFGMNDWTIDGANAEYCRALAGDVVPKPASIDHNTAASVPISALTAWQGLVDRARLARGDRVLIHGAAGGVGLFAVQIARRIGARIIGTASAHNFDFVRSLGADEVIDYHAGPFEAAAGKVDVVFDTVGGETLDRSWPLLSAAGRMVTVAASAEQANKQRVKDAFFIVERSGRQLRQIAALIDSGELRPHIGAVYPLSLGRSAYEQKMIRGKAVLSMTA